MAHVCYSLYFTDFVGEAVFNGDPKAAYGSLRYNLYEEGVRFGCFGMAMYSLSCACYSLIIEKLISRFRARNVYVGGVSSKFLCQECVYDKFCLIFDIFAAALLLRVDDNDGIDEKQIRCDCFQLGCR